MELQGVKTDDNNIRTERLLMGEVLSLQQLYWLAAGFCPTSTTVNEMP